MPIENSWGKSAVDATRKNALPPYLDELFENGLGSGIALFNVTIPANSTWATKTDDGTYYTYDYDAGLNDKNEPLIPSSAYVMIIPPIDWDGETVSGYQKTKTSDFFWYGIRLQGQEVVVDEDDGFEHHYVVIRARIDPGAIAIYFRLLVFGASTVGASTSNVVTSVNGKSGEVTLTKSDIGLSHVNDTADADKSVAQASVALQLPIYATPTSTDGVVTNQSQSITIDGETIAAHVLQFAEGTISGSRMQLAVGMATVEGESMPSMWIREYSNNAWGDWTAVGAGGAGTVDIDLIGAGTMVFDY